MNVPPPPGSWEGSGHPIRQYHAGPIPPEIYEDYPDGHGGPNPRQIPHRTSHAPGPYLLPQYSPQIAVQQPSPSASHNVYHAAPVDRMSSHSDHHGSLWPPQQVFDQSQSQPQHPTNAYPYTADSVTYASGLTAPYAEGGPGPGPSSSYDPLSALPSSSQSSSPLGHGLPPPAMSYGIPSTSGDFSNHGIPRGTLTPSAIYSESTIISYGTGSAPTNGTVVQEIKGSQSIYRSAGYGPMNPHHPDDPYSYPDPRYAGAVDVYGYPTGPQVKMKRKQVKVACSNCQQAST